MDLSGKSDYERNQLLRGLKVNSVFPDNICYNCDYNNLCSEQKRIEELYHERLKSALYEKEKNETIYYLNNIKSIPGSYYHMNSEGKIISNIILSDKELENARKYRKLRDIAGKTLHINDENKLYRMHLKYGFHKKDKRCYFNNDKENAIKNGCKIIGINQDVSQLLVTFLDDRCQICKRQLCVNFFVEHPNPVLICYACKVNGKATMTVNKAIKRWNKLNNEHFDVLRKEGKSVKVNRGKKHELFLIRDVRNMCIQLFGSLDDSRKKKIRKNKKRKSNDAGISTDKPKKRSKKNNMK